VQHRSLDSVQQEQCLQCGTPPQINLGVEQITSLDIGIRERRKKAVSTSVFFTYRISEHAELEMRAIMVAERRAILGVANSSHSNRRPIP
jgi:hypothetical protein